MPNENNNEEVVEEYQPEEVNEIESSLLQQHSDQHDELIPFWKSNWGLTYGIADNNAVKIDSATVADNDYAKFTANGLEGRSYSEVMSDLSGNAGGDFSMNSNKITSVTNPTSDQDAATKKYVDDNVYSSPYASFNVNGSQEFQDDGSPHSVSLSTFNCGFEPSLIRVRGMLYSSDPPTQPPYWIGQDDNYLEGIWDGTNYSGTTCYEYNDDLRRTTIGFLVYRGQTSNYHRFKLEVEETTSSGFTLRVKIENLGSIAQTIYWRFDIIAYA